MLRFAVAQVPAAAALALALALGDAGALLAGVLALLAVALGELPGAVLAEFPVAEPQAARAVAPSRMAPTAAPRAAVTDRVMKCLPLPCRDGSWS